MTRATSRAASVAARVVAWARRRGRRGMPWQGQRDPYRVWLSEVMLQQTQVATAAAYYERFAATYADVAALAAAPLDDVLALWSGLGYYGRARHLHRCAQTVVARHGGKFPRASAELALLPGIGRSTAAAIAAFCFDERAAILDGNVKRVLARHSGFAADLATAAAQRELWSYADSLLPKAADMPRYTQGLMDLGATVCLVRQPKCDACPLARTCVAHLTRSTAELPVKSRRTSRGQRSHTVLWLRHRGHVLLVRRPERGVWAGLWSLPEFADLRRARAAVSRWRPTALLLPTVHHALTHFDWQLQPLRCDLASRTSGAALTAIAAALGGRWVGDDEALGMSLPAPVRKLLGAAAGEVPRSAGARAG